MSGTVLGAVTTCHCINTMAWKRKHFVDEAAKHFGAQMLEAISPRFELELCHLQSIRLPAPLVSLFVRGGDNNRTPLNCVVVINAYRTVRKSFCQTVWDKCLCRGIEKQVNNEHAQCTDLAGLGFELGSAGVREVIFAFVSSQFHRSWCSESMLFVPPHLTSSGWACGSGSGFPILPGGDILPLFS